MYFFVKASLNLLSLGFPESANLLNTAKSSINDLGVESDKELHTLPLSKQSRSSKNAEIKPEKTKNPESVFIFATSKKSGEFFILFYFLSTLKFFNCQTIKTIM